MAEGVLTITGVEQVSSNLARLAAAMSDAAAATLNEIAEVTMTDAKERTPVLTGTLRRSGHVEHATPGELRATLAFGTEYAVWVHENLHARHANGEAKFLEHAVQKTAATFEQRMAAGIKARTGT